MPMSPSAKNAATLPETGEREVCLLTVTHPSWREPVRLSTDATTWLRNDESTGEPIYGTVSRGETYLYLPMRPVLPNSAEEAAPTAKISMDNVSRLLAPYFVQTGDEYPQVKVEVCLASSPDVIDQEWPAMRLTSAGMDASVAELSLSLNVAEKEPLPWLRFVPAYFPNLFD